LRLYDMYSVIRFPKLNYILLILKIIFDIIIIKLFTAIYYFKLFLLFLKRKMGQG